jgi:phosphoribosylformylglycinamidine synthase
MALEPPVDEQLAREHGLIPEEYALLREILGRTPTYTELGIASAMYSEHCSYKSSKTWLRNFPTEGPAVVQGPGENAGVVSIGHGLVAAFKMESHNHPSYIEPYQGAATGVGGILRDVFTMGARPIACMDSLSFGEIDAPRMHHLVDGVVRGIGDYGNCFGVPTVGGETRFHRSYNGNILVNAFALGVCREDEIFLASATGVGNPILYVGSRTGRDGIHGATMASESFDDESEAKRPTVQVGDPFTEKVLLEACLEAMQSGVVVAVQDMGAAGMTSSCFEMASRAGTGVEIDLDRVPLREAALTPYEIMLSESQERMVFVAQQGKENVVEKIFQKWGLAVVPVGQVTDTGRAVLRFDGEVVADMKVQPLVDEAPIYERPVSIPSDLAKRQAAPEVPSPEALGLSLGQALERMIGSPEFGDKSWIHNQYDSTVRTNTVVGPGGDAAVLRIKGTPSALAMTSDVNPVYCYLDPFSGGMQAVAEAARNLASVGALPLALTDCLNFGSPEIPEIAWQLRECIAGMAKACEVLAVPVVSGNVSLYNTTEVASIHPTPTVAMVGLIESLSSGGHPELRAEFQASGHGLVLLGNGCREFGGSAYLRQLFDIEQGLPPSVDLEAEARLGRLLRGLFAAGRVSTCHDLSDGGLAIALAEATLARNIGARVDLSDWSPSGVFAEDQGRVLVATKDVDSVLRAAEAESVPARLLGQTGGDDLVVSLDGDRLESSVSDLKRAWLTALPNALAS